MLKTIHLSLLKVEVQTHDLSLLTFPDSSLANSFPFSWLDRQYLIEKPSKHTSYEDNHLVLSTLCPRNTNSLAVALAQGILCQTDPLPKPTRALKTCCMPEMESLQTSLQWATESTCLRSTLNVLAQLHLSHCLSLGFKINCDWSRFNWSVTPLLHGIPLYQSNFPLKPNLLRAIGSVLASKISSPYTQKTQACLTASLPISCNPFTLIAFSNTWFRNCKVFRSVPTCPKVYHLLHPGHYLSSYLNGHLHHLVINH